MQGPVRFKGLEAQQGQRLEILSEQPPISGQII